MRSSCSRVPNLLELVLSHQTHPRWEPLSRCQRTGIRPSWADLRTMEEPAQRGYGPAAAAYGPSKGPNWSAQGRSEQTKVPLSRFRRTGIPPWWADPATMEESVQRG